MLVVTCGVDVQDDRLECRLAGWTRSSECLVLGHIVIWGSPDDDTTWLELDALLSTRWPHRSAASFTSMHARSRAADRQGLLVLLSARGAARQSPGARSGLLTHSSRFISSSSLASARLCAIAAASRCAGSSASSASARTRWSIRLRRARPHPCLDQRETDLRKTAPKRLRAGGYFARSSRSSAGAAAGSARRTHGGERQAARTSVSARLSSSLPLPRFVARGHRQTTQCSAVNPPRKSRLPFWLGGLSSRLRTAVPSFTARMPGT